MDRIIDTGGGTPPAIPGALEAARLAREVASLLGAAPGSPPGGLTGLVAAFEGAGLGHLIASWIGPGPNLPVTAAELATVLGPETMARFTAAAGGDAERVARGLAELLPRVVDLLTPAGVVPGADGGAARGRA